MLADPHAIPLAAARTGAVRRSVAETARRGAFVAFAVGVVISPFRASILLAAQPRPPLYAGYTDLAVSWGELAALVAVVLWATSVLAAPRPISIGPRLLWIPAVGLIGLGWASTVWSIDAAISGENALELTILAGFGLYVINEVPVERVPIIAAGMVAVEAVVAIGQAIVQGSLGWSALGELSLDPSVNGVSVVATSATDRLLRAYGLADHPNILGGLLAFALPLLILAVLRGRRTTRLAAGTALVLGAAALFLTFSRGAWLAAAAVVVIELGLLLRAHVPDVLRRLGLALAAAGLVVISLALADARYVLVRADVANPQVATEAMSTGERLILVDAAARLVFTEPVTGTGLGTAAIAVDAANPTIGFDAQPAPVVLLDVAIELGLLGILAYVALVIAPWVALARRSIPWTPEVIATSAALAAWAIVGLFDYYTWTFAAGRLWTVLLFGLWGAAMVRSVATEARGGAGTEPARG